MAAVDWAGDVGALHDFFTRWFHGTEPVDGFAAFEDRLAPGFTAVGPNGAELDRAGTLEFVRSMRGTASGGPVISIRDVREVQRYGRLALVRYIEVQDWQDGRHTERRSTALLEDDPAAPGGVRWHTVHETWIPADTSE